MLSMMRAYRNFPLIENLQETAKKLNDFINGHQLFLEARTSTKASRGVISFI